MPCRFGVGYWQNETEICPFPVHCPSKMSHEFFGAKGHPLKKVAAKQRREKVKVERWNLEKAKYRHYSF